jgi:hypothetical protein
MPIADAHCSSAETLQQVAATEYGEAHLDKLEKENEVLGRHDALQAIAVFAGDDEIIQSRTSAELQRLIVVRLKAQDVDDTRTVVALHRIETDICPDPLAILRKREGKLATGAADLSSALAALEELLF